MDKQLNPKRTQTGIDLVRRMAADGHRIFTIEAARQFSAGVGLKPPYLREALYHLRRTRWIVSLHRGLYAISSEVPGVAPVHEFEVAMALVTPSAISHWSALHHHGLTEQIPRKVFVLATSNASVPRPVKSKERDGEAGYPVGDTLYQFIQVRPNRFFGTMQVWVSGARVTMTDPERTLLDGLSMPQYCGDFSEVLHAFGVRGDKLDLDRIMNYALKLDVAVVKRLGWVLERQGIDMTRLEALRSIPIGSYRTLDPTGSRVGPRNRSWMIQENLPVARAIK